MTSKKMLLILVAGLLITTSNVNAMRARAQAAAARAKAAKARATARARAAAARARTAAAETKAAQAKDAAAAKVTAAQETALAAKKAMAATLTTVPFYLKNNLDKTATVEIYRGGPAAENMPAGAGEKVASTTIQPNGVFKLPKDMGIKQTYLIKITTDQNIVGYYVRDARKQINPNGVALAIGSIGNIVGLRPVELAQYKVTPSIGLRIFPVVKFPSWAGTKPVTGGVDPVPGTEAPATGGVDTPPTPSTGLVDETTETEITTTEITTQIETPVLVSK
jgi:hypothetical protein